MRNTGIGKENGSVKLWNLSKQAFEALPKCYNGGKVRSLSFSNDANYLASGSSDGKKVCLWNFQDSKQNIKIFDNILDVGNVYKVSFKPASQMIAIVRGDGIIDIREFKNLEEKKLEEKTVPPWKPYKEFNEKLIVDINFSKDGTRIATAGINGFVKLWEWSEDSSLPVELNTWNAYQDIDSNHHDNAFIHILFKEDNKLIAIVENEGTLKLWEYLEGKKDAERVIDLKSLEQSNKVSDASFNSSNQQLVIATNDKQIRLWDMRKETEPFPVTENSIKSIGVRSDTQENSTVVDIAVLDEMGKVKLRSLGEEIIHSNQLETYDSVTNVDFTPDGNQLVTSIIELLPQLYCEVIIPQAVLHELSASGAPPVLQEWSKNPPSWLIIQENVISGKSAEISIDDKSLSSLDFGERNAILLAEKLKADLIILDEREARKIAVSRNLKVIGLLGILYQAAIKDSIGLEELIERLQKTNFRASSNLLSSLLARYQNELDN